MPLIKCNYWKYHLQSTENIEVSYLVDKISFTCKNIYNVLLMEEIVYPENRPFPYNVITSSLRCNVTGCGYVLSTNKFQVQVQVQAGQCLSL